MNHTKTISRIALTMFLYILSVAAQAQTISGAVTDSLNKPIAFATVRLKDLNVNTITDLMGHYTFDDVAKGTHELAVSYVGYDTQIKKVTISGNNVTSDFKMKETVIMLDEVFITPTGESMALYIVRKVVENKKTLAQRIASYKGEVGCRLDGITNIKAFPESLLRKAHFVLGLLGYRKIFICLENHPDLRVEMAKDVVCTAGKHKYSKTRFTACKPELTQSEKDAFVKKDWKMEEDKYELIYGIMQRLGPMVRKGAKKYNVPTDSILWYAGKYVDNGNTIHILKTHGHELHIVENGWQVSRITYNDKQEKSYYEMQEIIPGAFLPVAGYKEIVIDITQEKEFKEEQEKFDKASKEDLSRRKAKKNQKNRDVLDRLAQKPRWSFVYSTTYNYKDIVAAKRQ